MVVAGRQALTAPETMPSDPSSALSILAGVPFTKMTGSGNDFVFFDARELPSGFSVTPEIIVSICNRHNGIGADGVVVLERSRGAADVDIGYFNSDGSAADLCGNATLCSTTLAAELGLADAMGMTLATPSGILSARVVDGMPEIKLPPITGLAPDLSIVRAPGEERIGFASAGIPHLVVLCATAEAVDVAKRGPLLRHHPSLGVVGANVNWVSGSGSVWRYRTFERGVEGETLACGTGAVATAAVLAAWHATTVSPVVLRTSSGRDLQVHFDPSDQMAPTLRGEGRVVFRGRIAAAGAQQTCALCEKNISEHVDRCISAHVCARSIEV